MTFGLLIEHLKINIFLQKICRKYGRETRYRPLFFFFKEGFILCKSKWFCSLTIFRQSSNQLTIETSCLKLYTIDQEICSISIFQIRAWEQFLQHILCIIFQQKSSSGYIVVTDQISLPGYPYFLRYWAICVLQWFINHVVVLIYLYILEMF